VEGILQWRRIYEYECFVSQTDPSGPKEYRWGISFEYQINSTIKVSFSAGYGQLGYDSNPNVSINNDAVYQKTRTRHSILERRFLKLSRYTTGLRIGN
jgi:hypothetical protein